MMIVVPMITNDVSVVAVGCGGGSCTCAELL